MNLIDVSGIGKKKVEVLATLGITNVQELLHYYPYKVEFKDYTDLSNEVILIKVKVLSKTKITYTRSRVNFFGFKGLYNNQVINFKVFNQYFLFNNFEVGDEISVEARIYKDEYTVSKLITNNEVPYMVIKYRSNKHINSMQIQKLIHSVLYNHHDIIEESIPEDLIQKYKLFSLKQAVYLIHNPKNLSDYNNSLRTLKYYEAYTFMKYLADEKVENKSFDFSKFDLMANIAFINSLDFELTQGQLDVVHDVYKDVATNNEFNRLIHGDVGCGKTLVSIIITQLFISNNHQVAILCPTEVLANQMFANFSRYLDNGVLLTKTNSKSETKEIYEDIANSKFKFIVGTHSILNDKLLFKNLSLVIIDEQHRFGVEQREKLIHKSDNVNTIMMSATPIPRTLGLILFDNLKLTPIKGMPKNRVAIDTVFETSLSNNMISDLKNEVDSGNLIYVVAPAITDNKLGMDSVETIYNDYCSAFDKKRIGVMHSQLSSIEKLEVMEKFKSGKISILISTTIIEVGVDIANASRIVIHSANRFGLSTLHQLRGRVGRGTIASKCYVINEECTTRLELFISSNDGFDISEADFKLRGPGNLVGTEQSGYNMFKVLNIYSDLKILESAKNDVTKN